MLLISSRFIKTTCLGILFLFSASAFSQQSTCAFNNVKNLNYQLQLTSSTGTLRRINVPKRNILIDREFSAVTILVDVRPILKQKAFRNGIAKAKLRSLKANTANDKLYFEINGYGLERRNAPLPQRLTFNNFPFLTFLDRETVNGNLDGSGGFDDFERGERVNISFRPFREFRKDVDVVIADISCNIDPDLAHDDLDFFDEI